MVFVLFMYNIMLLVLLANAAEQPNAQPAAALKSPNVTEDSAVKLCIHEIVARSTGLLLLQSFSLTDLEQPMCLSCL